MNNWFKTILTKYKTYKSYLLKLIKETISHTSNTLDYTKKTKQN